ncbi:NUAK family SNF1-like kinase 1 [Spea bombifrons]|uniref:NUAK family SNF1-like kinase 1 n=1 Tax=Spea bombifrons TaxID=233779 RepID=UPI00234A179F|nr:NUAK family SNF1-like kinase 1 [Spea bombifrons]
MLIAEGKISCDFALKTMTGVTCGSEDNDYDQVTLANKMTIGHPLGCRKGAEHSRDGVKVHTRDGASPCRSRDADTSSVTGAVKKHHHKHSIKHRYELLETLGRGTYGKVKRAIERDTGKMVAVKSIQKEKITDELDRVHLQREIEITALLRHEHIIQVFEVFESRDKIIIVMEYASNGELYDFINNKHQISESEARGIFRQIVSAVHYCHKNGIVHRDIKLENILLDDKLNVKLADFGLSNFYHKNQVLETYCGSPLYASPEILNGLPYQGPEVDCWALGVLLYALVYGSMPFDNSSYKTLAEQIRSGHYRQPPHLSGACGLIDWTLAVNSANRATIEDMANHWWVNWGYDSVVCDCDSVADCHSPLLARYIECQNTLGFKGTNKKQSGGPLEKEEYEGCLRKSKKENDINQSQQELSFSVPSQKPKGILKKRSSFDSSFLNSSAFSEKLTQNGSELNGEAQTTPACSPHTSANNESQMPKKGILKKTYERESGYSSSPERIISPSDCHKASLRVQEEKTKPANHLKRRKGILKRNGRFSTSLDLPVDCSALSLSDSLEDLIFSNAEPAVSPSRPSSVISDDSFLSSDSFDLLDMVSETKSQLFTYTSQNVYSSEEDDLLSGKLIRNLSSKNHQF